MPPVSTLTRINRQLAKQGRAERLVRGRGYYYVTQADVLLPRSAIYQYRIGPDDYAATASEVRDILREAGITVTFEP